tara:strand:+ start:548 stop:2431 length:1884 start_codon:yes stop_codon:yes gene_type:complete
MAINTKGKLEITDLDFDSVKSNFKTFLSQQSGFTDYNFEGSGMSVLMDLLAYNTHYQAFHANMLANEMFLDTSLLRASAVSHAKALGYTPTSMKASNAMVTVTVKNVPISQTTLTMSAGTIFNTTVNDIQYQFVTIADHTATSDTGTFEFADIQIYEGTRINYTYTTDTSNLEQQFVIPSAAVDTGTLVVRVQTSSTDTTTETYTLNTDYTTLISTSKVYFLQEIENGRFEIYFGDGVFGYKPINGNIVILDYVVTNGALADGASTFKASTTIGGYSSVTALTTSAASGGGFAETVDSIKFNAPLKYASQGRAVTPDDYKSILPSVYTNIKSVQVWGGEDNDPPIYGRVYVSIRPKTGDSLTNSTKSQIIASLKKYNVASVTPVIVDPEILQLVLTTTVKYNSTLTTKTNSDLKAVAETTISTFNTNNLEKFDAVFRHSNLLQDLDASDQSILSSTVAVKLKRSISPTLNTDTKYTVNFNNAAYHPAAAWTQTVVESGGFYLSGNTNVQYIDDDGSGNIRTFYLLGGTTKTITNATAGTINYTTGQVVLTSFNITAIIASSGKLDITIKPDSNDVIPVRNQVVEIDTVNGVTTAEVDTFATGESTAGVGYTTKSSTATVGSVYTTSS